MPLYSLDGEAPQVGANVFIAPGAHVIGRVVLGDNVSVWFGAVIRGDNEWIHIGEETNIQDNATLHSDMGSPLAIAKGCTIGHNAIVHGCTLGEACLVGMGATILNGANIGSHSIVGAHALVTEGKKFPDGSLIVGAPARVARSIDEATRDALEASAAHYVRNGRRFAAGLKAIES